jgi:hypothetical protein
LVFSGLLLIKSIVATCFGLVAAAVVRIEPKVITVLSVAEAGPESVEVISHQVQPEYEATCTTPQAYFAQTLNFFAKTGEAERTPRSSVLVGIFA